MDDPNRIELFFAARDLAKTLTRLQLVYNYPDFLEQLTIKLFLV